MNFTKYSKYFALITVSIITCLFFWYSFYTDLPGKIGFPHTSLETVFSNYDGPNYLIIAKCGYIKNCIAKNYSLPQPLEYYPAHLPGYPLLIKYFSLYTTAPKAMLFSTLLGSIFLTLVSFEFFKIYLKPNNAYYLSVLLIFFPARLLILRLVGAPETWFIALTLLSVIFLQRQKYLFSAIYASLAIMFKSPGILLFIAYSIFFLTTYLKNRKKSLLIDYLPYLLIPSTALLIFFFYYYQIGDFWAYFHSGDNIHLGIFPYMVFISNHTWINTIWLEDIIYLYLISFYGIKKLYRKVKNQITYIYPLLFVIAGVFVAHRDISRYLAPVYPFLFLAFSKFLLKRNTRLIFLLVIPAIILYVFNFIIGNTAPIADWSSYL